MHLSSFINDAVTLPIDEELYYKLLSEKIKNSTFKKKSSANTLNVNGTF